ncbi:unnamed protein product [Didymodactylos carnosus]|uniref:Nicotinate-nucleotide pyrophosphorylase [carboxylating] n=1 Tax=Didymodactylos carnosus TaxID=1234261 RepID=A0A814ETY2_9BILA|nr:unnamed protein product [Didymodactylos carnosus]CAF0972543.1 unnamed protein product [Didymodactylos carnosus]CAF3562223.1 unnamed protein product [Didymodactylos carnosus]CAF3745524.1 unnamed protein product [Didymodactylos carnosus]
MITVVAYQIIHRLTQMSATSLTNLECIQLKRLISISLEEDLSIAGDITSTLTIPSDSKSTGHFLAKQNGFLSGLEVAQFIFQEIDSALEVKWTMKDGDHITESTYFGTVTGNTRSLLIAERLVLNIMQRMSGIATATAKMVEKINCVHSKTRLLDTRKTVPGMRFLDKMAVRHGGGLNHRFGLFDMIMIKDNHITAAGGIRQALDSVLSASSTEVPIEIETRTLDEVRQVLEYPTSSARLQRIMLDNMVTSNGDTSMLKQALELINSQFQTEASGNVTLDTIGEIAKTNVDFVSTGSITHSVLALDISMKIKQNY